MYKIELQIPLALSARNLTLAPLPGIETMRPFLRVEVKPLAKPAERELVIGENIYVPVITSNIISFRSRTVSPTPRPA